MSIAIHITTHAPLAAATDLVASVREIVEALDAAKAPDAPATAWSIYGNDYSDAGHPVKDIRVDEASLAADEQG